MMSTDRTSPFNLVREAVAARYLETGDREFRLASIFGGETPPISAKLTARALYCLEQDGILEKRVTANCDAGHEFWTGREDHWLEVRASVVCRDGHCGTLADEVSDYDPGQHVSVWWYLDRPDLLDLPVNDMAARGPKYERLAAELASAFCRAAAGARRTGQHLRRAWSIFREG